MSEMKQFRLFNTLFIEIGYVALEGAAHFFLRPAIKNIVVSG
jgi:hypothetical protein